MKNPDFAQIKMMIDDNEFHPARGQAPDHIVEMEITRVSESTLSETSITVYDDSALVVEAMLLSQGPHILKIQYGWGDELSKVYVREVSRYEMEFNSQGTTLTIESIPNSTGDVLDETPQAITGTSLVDIVNQYCSQKGIEIDGTIEESEAKYATDISTAEAEIQYPREGETDEEFIRRMLSSCVPKSGGSYDVVMTDETDSEGNVTRHLKVTTTGGSGNSSPVVKKFTYVIGMEHEEVISFTPENAVGLVAGYTGASLVACGVNPLTNDVQVVSTQRLDSQGKTVRRIAGSCYTNNEMISIQNAIMNGMANQQYTAELELVGSVGIEPEDQIEMTVLTKDGYEHHSSGIYTVKQVTDAISGGSFTTTLLMCKGMDIGSATTVNGESATPSKYSFVENYAYKQLYGFSFIPQDVPDHNLLGHVQDLMGIKYVAGGTSVATGLDAGSLMHHLVYRSSGKAVSCKIKDLVHAGAVVSGGKSSWRVGDLLFWSAPIAVSGGSGASTSKDEGAVWDYLYQAIGNEYGVAGIMGNMQNESGIIACRMQGDFSSGYSTSKTYADKVDSGAISRSSFVNNGPNGGGWGLVQWTYYTLKEKLYDYAKATKQSIGSLKMQLEFLVKNLQEDYPSVWKSLKSATSVRQAASVFLYQFERPDDQSQAVENQRTADGEAIFKRHSGSSPTEKAKASDDYVHVACYIGNGYIFQTTSAYGYSHISKLSSTDYKSIGAVRRIDGVYTCKPTEDGYKKQDISAIGNISSITETDFKNYCTKNNLTEALNSSGVYRQIAKFAVLAAINNLPYYWAGGHWSYPVLPGWEGNNFGAKTSPDSKGRALVGLDCSGFTGWCYLSAFAALDMGIPPICGKNGSKYYSETVTGACNKLTKASSPQVGDYLAFADFGHTGIYMGNGMCIHCSSSKNKCVLANSSSVGFVYQYRL